MKYINFLVLILLSLGFSNLEASKDEKDFVRNHMNKTWRTKEHVFLLLYFQSVSFAIAVVLLTLFATFNIGSAA